MDQVNEELERVNSLAEENDHLIPINEFNIILKVIPKNYIMKNIYFIMIVSGDKKKVEDRLVLGIYWGIWVQESKSAYNCF